LYELALGQWRGAAFADLDTSWAAAMREALEAERFAARLDHHDVRLRQGQHAELLGDLTAVVAAHPLDERLVRQHMLALYRSGRQADALRQYERTRQLLDEELAPIPAPACSSCTSRS
jgi:DNA-binding SARP family transcriptional activator